MCKQILAVFLIAVTFFPRGLFAAIAANTIWEVRPTVGSDTNGGGFSIGVGTPTTGTDLAIDATTNTNISSSGHGTFAGNAMQYIKITSSPIYSVQTVGANNGGSGCTSATATAGGNATITVAVSGGVVTGYTVSGTNTGYTTIPTVTVTPTGCASTPLAAATLSFNLGFYQIISSSGSEAVLPLAAGQLSASSGGWSVYPGVDYSQQAGAQVAITTNATCTTASTITFNSGYTPSSADLGNILQVPPGISGIAPGAYQIISETSSAWGVNGSVPLCTTPGSVFSLGTGSVSSNMGGALASLTGLAAAAVTGNTAFVKATGTMTLPASSTFTLATSNTISSTVPPFRIIGYTSSRTETPSANCGTCVDIQPGSTGETILTVSGGGYDIENFHIDGTGTNTVGTCAAVSGSNVLFHNIKCDTFTATGISITGNTTSVIGSEILNGQSGCTAGISNSGSIQGNNVIRSSIHGNSCLPVSLAGTNGSVLIEFDKIYNNGTSNNCISFVVDTSIFNNTLDGCNVAIVGHVTGSATLLNARNNLITNATVGIEAWTSAGFRASALADGNCYWSVATPLLNYSDEGITEAANAYPYRNHNDVILTSNPYADPTHANDNYTITNTSGAFQAGTPGALPGSSQIGYMTCGAYVPLAPAGTSGAVLNNAILNNGFMK